MSKIPYEVGRSVQVSKTCLPVLPVISSGTILMRNI